MCVAKCAMFFNTFTCVAGVAPKCSCESELWVSYGDHHHHHQVKWKWMDGSSGTLVYTLLYIFMAIKSQRWWGFNFFVRILCRQKTWATNLMIKVKKSHLWLVLSVVMAFVRGIEKISYCQSRFRVRVQFLFIIFSFFLHSQTKENRFLWFLFEGCAHTHTQKYTDGKVHKNKKRQKS